MKIDSNFVARYAEQFKGKYVTTKGYFKLAAHRKKFHLFGTWNELRDDGEYLYHFRMDKSGEMKEISKSLLSDLKHWLWIPCGDTFILFRVRKGWLTTEYAYNRLSRHTAIDEKRQWLHDNGVKIWRRVITFNDRMLIDFEEIDAFTGKTIAIPQQ